MKNIKLHFLVLHRNYLSNATASKAPHLGSNDEVGIPVCLEVQLLSIQRHKCENSSSCLEHDGSVNC